MASEPRESNLTDLNVDSIPKHHEQTSSQLQLPIAASIKSDKSNDHDYGQSLSSYNGGSSYIPSPKTPKTYSEEIVRKMRIGLLYLLHDESPLMNSREVNSQLMEDANDGNHKNHKETNKFGQRCQEFNITLSTSGKNINKVKKLINQLWTGSERDIEDMEMIHSFWDQWLDFDPEYDDDSDAFGDNEFGDIKADPIEEQQSLLQVSFKAFEEDSMKRDYLDFMYQYDKYTAKYEKLDKEARERQIREAKSKRHAVPPNSDTQLAAGSTPTPMEIEEKRTSGLQDDMSHTKPQQQVPRKSPYDEDDSLKNLQLNRIKSRKAMQSWLKTYKQTKSEISGIRKILKRNVWKKDLNFRVPMMRWNWQQVVSFIEDNEELKHFSSIFYEYQINGQELCCFNGKLMEYLIETALLSNHNVFETDFDKFKTMSKTVTNDWTLSQQIKQLLKYVQKGRIQSHIISRYYLSWEILRRKRAKNETAQTIYEVLGYLKPHLSNGPKNFWKMQAYFYCKIDNFLAVLCTAKDISKIYRRLNPKFLMDNEEEEETEDFPDPNNPKLQMKRDTATKLRVVQTGPRNWRLRSIDPFTNRSTYLQDVDLYGDDTESNHGAILKKDTVDSFLNHNHKNSVDNMFRSSKFLDINPVKKKKRHDCFDIMADKCCKKHTKMNQYIHAIPRLYLKSLAMLIFACVFGCIFTTEWYYDAAITATDDAMKLTIESIGEREVNYVNYQLFAPQSLQSIGFGEIKIQADVLDIYGINDTATRDAYINDASLDYLLVEWSYYANTQHIANFFLYNNNTNTLIGGYKGDNDSLIISVYNGTCRREWYYNSTMKQRDYNKEIMSAFDCDYTPRSRPWYTELVDVGGVENSVWTKPYYFQEGTFGITLSTAIEHNGVVYLFLNELTINSIQAFYEDERLLLPQETVVMLVTPSMDILLSSEGEIDFENVPDCDLDYVDIDCTADDEMIRTSIKYLRENLDDVEMQIEQSSDGYIEVPVDAFWVNIFPFDALYMESLLFGSEPQVGYIMITYNEVHWKSVDDAYIISWIISGLMLFCGCMLILYNIKFHRQKYFERQLSKSIEFDSKSIRDEVVGPDGMTKLKGFDNVDYDGTNDNNPAYKNGNEAVEEEEEQKTPKQQETAMELNEDDVDKDKPMPAETEMAQMEFQTTNLDDNDEDNEDNENDDGRTELTEMTPQPASVDENGAMASSSGTDGNDDMDEAERKGNKELDRRQSKLKQMSVDTATTDGSNPERNALINTVPLKGDGNSNEIEQSPTTDMNSPESKDQISRTTGDTIVEGRANYIPDTPSKRLLKKLWEPKWCQLSPGYMMVVLFAFMTFTFLTLVVIWTGSAGSAIDVLIDDVMAPQEWNVVRDKVFQLMESAESVKQIVENRLNDDSIQDIFEFPEFDRIFTNIQKSFVNSNNEYNQYFVYIGTPDGSFRGARVLETNETDLAMTVRDETTNYTRYTWYTDDDNVARNYSRGTFGTNHIYDPRCRPWYRSAITNRFSGRLQDAFPDGTWNDFSYDDLSSLSRQTQACKDAVSEYAALWNVTEDDSYSNTSINQDYDYGQYLVWSTYVFTSLNAIGITASAAIKEEGSDRLIGVVGIDYTLDAVSSILNESIGDEHEDQNWYSWIFNANETDPFMIASSDFQVLTTTENVDGCLQLASEEQKIPYSAANHPDTYIRIISQEVIDYYRINGSHPAGFENGWIINTTTPWEMEIPIDYPLAQGGRISYYPDDSGLDWMVMKLVDVTDITAIEGDALKTSLIVLMMILVLSFICFKEVAIQYANYTDEDDNGSGEAQGHDPVVDDTQDYLKDMFKMKKIVEGAANKVWLHLQQDIGDGLMTTETANDFLARRANQFITAENDRNQVFLKCVLQYTRRPGQRTNWTEKFMKFMFSNWYSVPCQIIIAAHILITFWEPDNLTKLAKDGLSTNLIFIISACIFLEFFFSIVLNTIHRYAIFSIRREHLIIIYELYYGLKHDWTKKVKDESKSTAWLVIFGPHHGRYMLRIVIWTIILFDFILRLTTKTGFFSYRCSALPWLFLVENRHVWTFFWDFMSALRYAGDVVASYGAFILIFALLGMSLFGSTDLSSAEKTVDSFDSITRSLITAYVYISTSENYDAVVAETFIEQRDADTLVIFSALAVCLVFVVLGLFTFIPMIIHRFEAAFTKSRHKKQEAIKYKKSQALIAAFIMLDMDGNLEIDRTEFQQLVTHSILINKNKLFDIFNTDGNDVIDINEFVSNLSKQEFRSKMFYQGEQSQNKLQAWLECNVYRRYRNRLMAFIILVLPVVGMALLRGLYDIDSVVVDYLLHGFFVLNLIDILLRWFAFGWRRYLDLVRYPNPPFTTAAVNKYNSKRKIPILNDDDSDKIIRLSANDRQWVVNSLRDTRPQSVLERSVLTVCHRLETSTILICTAIYWAAWVVLGQRDAGSLTGYQRHVLELGLFMRFFTCLRSNQKLVYVIFTVFPQFAALITFLVLFIYFWARLGCTLFGDGVREIITEEVYPQSTNISTNFNTLSMSMLSLIQLMIGEGWHEIMYYNVMSTSLVFSSYFIFYTFFVTIIIANTFVGLFLADIDELKTKQEDEDTLGQYLKRSSKFKEYAKTKLKELHYELQQIDDRRNKKLKQIETFNNLLNNGNNPDSSKSLLNQSLWQVMPTDRGENFSLFD